MTVIAKPYNDFKAKSHGTEKFTAYGTLLWLLIIFYSFALILIQAHTITSFSHSSHISNTIPLRVSIILLIFRIAPIIICSFFLLLFEVLLQVISAELFFKPWQNKWSNWSVQNFWTEN